MPRTPNKDIAGGQAWVAISKSDSDLARTPTVGLYVGTAGDVKVRDAEGNDTTIPSVPAGTILPGFFLRVWSTGTTAGGFVAIY